MRSILEEPYIYIYISKATVANFAVKQEKIPCVLLVDPLNILNVLI